MKLMDNGNNLFSKEAMEKLKSPEKLDSLLEVTNPVGWMALAAMVVMIFSVIMWSIFGAMVVKVDGVGILLDSAGVVSVTPVSSGRITEVYVRPGMTVRSGDLLAVIEQPEQSVQTNVARTNMHLSESRREALANVSQYDAKLFQHDVSSLVFSDYTGVIAEVSVMPGTVVSAGTSICTIRRSEKRDDITGVFYVPISNAKRIEPGMTIQLSPNGVDSSEDGNLLAVVRSISQYPVSANAMLKKLANQQLVQWVLGKADNAVMEITFDLVKDENSESGYLWTSIVGRHKPVTPGSICTGSVIVDSRPPIEKVFYKFSQWLRSR